MNADDAIKFRAALSAAIRRIEDARWFADEATADRLNEVLKSLRAEIAGIPA